MQVVPLLVTATNNRIKDGGAGTLYLWYSLINVDPGLGITGNVTSSTFIHRHLYSLYVLYAIITFCTVYLSKRYSSTVVLWQQNNFSLTPQ
jgi:hypothetical protein